MSASLPRTAAIALATCTALAGCMALAGCGKTLQRSPYEEGSGMQAPAGAGGVSTRNTTRIGGPNAAVDAAAIARVVYPAVSSQTRPQAVVLVPEGNWPAALAASVLAGTPLHAPLLYTSGFVLPQATDRALGALRPAGASSLGGIQAIRVGEAAAPPELRLRSLTASEPAQLAVAVERLLSGLRGRDPRQVIVAASDAPPAMTAPAAGLAAQTGAPILFVRRSAVPRATHEELTRLRRPSIYIVGPSSVVDDAVLGQLSRFGSVTRIAGGDPASNAVAVARFSDGSFGWGIRESGHGFVFANPSRPFDAPPAAALSASGDYAPLLLLDDSGAIPPTLAGYVSDLQPGIPAGGPVRGVYNHGWLIGDMHAIPAATQAKLDAMLEISPQKTSTEPALEPSESTTSGESPSPSEPEP